MQDVVGCKLTVDELRRTGRSLLSRDETEIEAGDMRRRIDSGVHVSLSKAARKIMSNPVCGSTLISMGSSMSRTVFT